MALISQGHGFNSVAMYSTADTVIFTELLIKFFPLCIFCRNIANRHSLLNTLHFSHIQCPSALHEL